MQVRSWWARRGLVALGVGIVAGSVLLVERGVALFGLVLLGGVLALSGIWRDERKYLALRAEVEFFLDRVRRLNRVALVLKQGETPKARQAFEELRRELHEAVDRIAMVAGKTADEMAAEETGPVPALK